MSDAYVILASKDLVTVLIDIIRMVFFHFDSAFLSTSFAGWLSLKMAETANCSTKSTYNTLKNHTKKSSYFLQKVPQKPENGSKQVACPSSSHAVTALWPNDGFTG